MNLIKIAYLVSLLIILIIILAIVYICYLFYPSLESISNWIFPVLAISILIIWGIFIASRYNSHKINDKAREKIITLDMRSITDKIPKGKSVKVCPNCGSTNVSFYGSNVVHDFCRDCGYGHDITPFSASLNVFPEIEGTGANNLDKLSPLGKRSRRSQNK